MNTKLYLPPAVRRLRRVLPFLAVIGLFLTVSPAKAVVSLALVDSFRGTNGAAPQGQMVLGTNGLFYGTAPQGGDLNQGVVFTATATGTIRTLVSFAGTNGAQPLVGLVQGPDGNFYGTTSSGGSNQLGTIFKVTPVGELTTLYSFDGANGSRPLSPLIFGFDGNLYGTTSLGGANNVGTIFTYNFTSGLPVISSTSFLGSIGAQPAGNLVQTFDGTIYGTTTAGGVYGYGTVFALTPPVIPGGIITNVYSFTGGRDGAGPQGGLTIGSDGFLYGTTAAGGTNINGHGPSGTIFAIIPGGIFSLIHLFTGTDGATPFGALLPVGNGMLYGTTSSGGMHNLGTTFGFVTSGAFANLHSFVGSEGMSPYGGLTIGTNGNLFGVTSGGGKVHQGALYKMTGFSPFILLSPTNQTVLSGGTVSFSVVAGGSFPVSYRWQLNSNNIASNRRITGITGSTLTLSNVTPRDAGLYTVIVRNSSGQTLSAAAQLNVIPRPSLKIVTPTPNSVITHTTINIGGTAGGDAEVARVYNQVDGGGWQLATTSDNWSHWRATIVVPTGNHQLDAFAESVISTYSPTNTVFFSCPPFVPVQGAYQGLFLVADEVNQTNSGSFSLTLNPKGSFSGYLQSTGSRHSFTGSFDIDGNATVTIRRTRDTPLTLSLQLDFEAVPRRITGSVSNVNWIADLSANRSAFNSRTNPAPLIGRYTFNIPGGEDPATIPGGDSYGTVTVDGSGKISAAISLADGTKFTQAAALAADGSWPLFAPLYSSHGSIFGWMSFTNPPDSVLGGNLTWFKPAQPKVKYYPVGFVAESFPAGGLYHAPSALVPILNATNASVVLFGGDLQDGITNQVKIGAFSHVTNLGPQPLTLTISTSSGSFSGSVVDPASLRKITFAGAIREDLGLGAGYFLGTNETGRVLIMPAAPSN